MHRYSGKNCTYSRTKKLPTFLVPLTISITPYSDHTFQHSIFAPPSNKSPHLPFLPTTKKNMPTNYPAGPSKLPSKQDSGEFTDSEDEGIPLSDIREAEFSRLSHDQAPILHSEPSSARPLKLSAFSWPWRWDRRKRKQPQTYLPVGEDEAQSLAAQRVTTSKGERKRCSCQKVGWVIM